MSADFQIESGFADGSAEMDIAVMETQVPEARTVTLADDILTTELSSTCTTSVPCLSSRGRCTSLPTRQLITDRHQ